MSEEYKRKNILDLSYNSYNKHSELAYFLFTYLFPLLGLPRQKAEELDRWDSKGKIRESFSQDVHNIIYIAVNHQSAFTFQYDRKLADSDIRLAKNIIDVYYSFCRFRWAGTSQSRPYINYYTKNVAEKNYQMVVQTGICNWIVGNIAKKDNKIYDLMDQLEKWSVKTYEGRKVSFGLLINKKDQAKSNACNFVDFMNDDYSATLTDCITSVIELDRRGNYLGYYSITHDEKIKKINMSPKHPYRFAQILENFVKEEKVGIFLLSNGDILLAVDGQIRFIKRNLKWLNMSYDAFINAIEIAFDRNTHVFNPALVWNQKLIDSVYASMLDISFSHTGGIIAIVNSRNALEIPDSEGKKTLSDIDNLHFPIKKIKGETYAKIIKRKMIRSLVNNKKFWSVDRKLRSELIAMDGACIIGADGVIHAFGAIIKSDSGTTQGGSRGAACQKLSKNGAAIKISTDGYIELYINEVIEYQIK